MTALHSSLRRTLGAAVVATIGVIALAVSPASAAEHVVREGENLTTIARRYGVSAAEIARVNGLQDPNHLLVGTKLQLPARSASGRTGVVKPAATKPASSKKKVAPTKTVAPGPEKAPMFDIADDLQRQIARQLERAANEFGVSPALLKALTYTESRWRQDAVSQTGAVGVGQLLPDTAGWLSTVMREPDLDLTSRSDNIRMAAFLLRWLLDHTSSTGAALASYYQGITAVLRSGVSPLGASYAHVVASRRAWFD